MASEQPDIPEDAVSLGEEFEGFSAKPYRDPAGVWTIGYGSTHDQLGHPITAHTPAITKVIAEGLMRRDLTKAAIEVSADVHVPMTKEERAALIDFVYNVGIGAFKASTLLRKLNAGDYHGAADEFARWDQAGGHVLAGLIRRRAAERAEFLKGQP
jgi:lysozyme